MSSDPGRPPRLATLTTLRVGGAPRALVTAETTDDLEEVVRSCDRRDEPVLIVGGGSNLVVADAGFDGTVVLVRTTGVEVRETGESVTLDVASGHGWDALVDEAVEAGWSGIEALSGIPGQVGATPIQNVGAYGAEVSQVIESVEVLDRMTGERGRLSADACGFGYRTSALKRTPDRWVVLAVRMVLPTDRRSSPVRYRELARSLGVDLGARVASTDVREAVLALRRGKGMVLDPADHDTWSAGSFFTNPVLPPEQAATLPDEAPRFPQPDGRVKTSAAWLIDHAGFGRGFRIRLDAPASLSDKHVLALTNRGGASADDLLDLARVVRAGVQEAFGVTLVNEPVLVGCSL